MRKVVEKLRGQIHPRHEKAVAGARARYIQKMAFRTVRLLEVGFVGDVLDSRLQREDLVVTGCNDDSSELQALGEVHGSNCDGP